MFYDLNLDDRSCREIEEKAVFQIPKECPEWTTSNPADPGITLVQLFSWLSEKQQKEINRSNEWKRRKYLQLLGAEVLHRRSSLGAVHMELGQAAGFSLPKGTRFYTGDMAFETVEKEWVQPARLMGAYMLQQGGGESYCHIEHGFGRQLKLYPFGERPETGNQCCFVLDQGLDPVHKIDIYFDICTEYGKKRNPADQGFLPLAELKWEYYSKDGWEELQTEFDYTYAFLQSGKVRFYLQKEMALEEHLQAYLIRVTLQEHELDVAPLIQNVYLNEIEVKQQYSVCDFEECTIDFSCQEETVSCSSSLYLAESGLVELYVEKGGGWVPIKESGREKTPQGEVKIWFSKPKWAKGVLQCMLAVFEKEMKEKRVIGRGNAFANQVFALQMDEIVYDDFELLAYDKELACFRIYHKLEDFDACTPEDAAYVFDTASGKLLFGDCDRGLAPEGELRILRLRFSKGSAGNIKAGRIRQCEAYPELSVKQYRDFQGGRDEESISQCFQRFRQELKKIHRGVTYKDYEELACNAPGLLIADSRVILPKAWEETKASPQENQISIVVQPVDILGEHTALSKRYRQNLRRTLERQKMLGTSIEILEPIYIAVTIHAEIFVKPQYLDAEKQMRQAVREYLDEKSWEMGKPVLYSVIYGILDTLPCVRRVKSLSVGVQGGGSRYLPNKDAALPPNGLAYLKDAEFNLYTAD